MIIGIDASRALRPIKTGTEWYNVEIIRHLVKIDQKNNYILYSNKPPEAPLLNLPDNVSWKIMPFIRGWTMMRLSLEMMIHPPDVLFVPAHTLPPYLPKKSVVMIHDLGFIHNPELYPTRQIIYHKLVTKFDAKYATHILAPTEYTKQDIIKTLGADPEKVTTVWHGYDQNLYQPKPLKDHPSIQHTPYIFYIGRLETKKNIVNLIKAFQILREKDPSSSLKLILAGKPSHGYDKIQESINNLSLALQKDIIQLGYLPEEEVSIYMSNAELFAFPTSFEGFGMPIIQAMACGCPVVASNNTCIPEITGDAAVLINPENPEDIADGMQKIIANKSFRDELKHKGLKQASKFSWDLAAKQTLEVLEKVGKQ